MSAIGHQGVFRLSRWSCQIQAEFQGFRPTWEKHNKKNNDYAYRTLTRSGTAFQRLQLIRSFYQTFRTHDSRFTCAPTTPQLQRLSAITQPGFGLIRFRSPLLTESLLFSLPMGTEMFHFPTFPPTTLYIQAEVAGHNSGNSRFPYSEIHGSKLVYQLPMAYRRLQRPPSALGAKASTDRT